MTNLNNDLSELLKKHISIFEESEKNWRRASQLDYLSFWVDIESLKNANPFGVIRDNPNLEPTEYPNVYQFIDEKQILLQYFPSDWSDPISILQWYKIKTPSVDKWKISIYWKWLRLYYCGLLPRLPNYVCKYAWEVYRADVCFDRKEKYPAWIVDMDENLQKGSDDSWIYKTYWNEKSPLFIRIYDKTLDLKEHKRFAAWIYPSWYRDSCRRLEAKFTWRYAKSQTALEWLWINQCDWIIEKKKEAKRDYLRSVFYNLIMYVDLLPSKQNQYDLLTQIKNLTTKKLNKLKDFTSIDDIPND